MQFVLPPWDHPAASENEVCFVTYCNSSNQIPDEDKTDDELVFDLASPLPLLASLSLPFCRL